MKKLLLSFFIFLVIAGKSFSNDCANGRYLNAVFQQVDITKNIQYARKKQSDGQFIDLKYDVYQPHGDTIAQRPVMLLIHGGAYLKILDQNSPDIVLMCDYFAQRGYVCVSIDYRQEANLLSILSEEAMVKAVSRALIDTKDAVDHFIGTYMNGNPYRIDTSKTIMGGVSAGAVSTMFICYLDSLQMMPEKYRQWVIDANDGINADSILRHKFDFVKPKIAISVSGGLLDTNWIKPNNIDFLLDHGSYDAFVPYTYGYPLNLTSLPKLYGGKTQYPRMINQGIRVEFEDWIGRGHVPFMNLDVGNILTFNLINKPILDSTERHIAHFCYSLMDCSAATGIQNKSISRFSIIPNPSSGLINIQLPELHPLTSFMLSIIDISGKTIYHGTFTSNNNLISLFIEMDSGIYVAKLSFKDSKEYIATFIVTP